MTLAELAVTVGVLAVLGLAASRFGLSAIPAYLLAGLLLGPNEPKELAMIEPSEVTDFVAQLGIVFLLFFLGLEFTLGRLARSRRHAVLGGVIDVAIIEDLEMALGELHIEWVPVPDTSPWIGKTLAEAAFRARTGVTIIAILREPEPVTGAQPQDIVQRGDTLVTVAKGGAYPAFRRSLAGQD